MASMLIYKHEHPCYFLARARATAINLTEDPIGCPGTLLFVVRSPFMV